MKKYGSFLIYFIYLNLRVYSQEISEEQFGTLLSQTTPGYFDNKNKRHFGCGLNLDCSSFQIFFTEIVLNKQQRRLFISGYVDPLTRANGDTIGTNVFKVFLAKPKKLALKKITTLLDVQDSLLYSDQLAKLNAKKMSFKITVPMGKKRRLYFETTSLRRFKEYQIDKLLKY
jgi:hypothetical protein